MTEMEASTTKDPIDQLVESWRLAKEYERIDEERLSTDVMYAVLEHLDNLSKEDRKLFWKEVDSAKQNGN